MKRSNRKVVFFTGHGRQGTTFVAHAFASRVDCYNLIENTQDPLIEASVKAYKKILPEYLRNPNRASALERYFLEDPAWVAARKSGKPIVCKSPWNTLIVPFLRNLFPAARFIDVSRFPNDTIVSIRDVYREVNAFAPVREHTVIGILFDAIEGFEDLSFIGRWAATIKYFHDVFLSSIDEDASPMRIRYEDLLREDRFEATLMRMIEFSDLAPRSERKLSEEIRAVNANRIYGCSGAEHPVEGRLGRFAKELSPEENMEIYAICGRMIERDDLYRTLWNAYASQPPGKP